MIQTDMACRTLIALFGMPFVALAIYAIMTHDSAMVKALCPVGWLIMVLILVGVWVNQ